MYFVNLRQLVAVSPLCQCEQMVALEVLRHVLICRKVAASNLVRHLRYLPRLHTGVVFVKSN